MSEGKLQLSPAGALPSEMEVEQSNLNSASKSPFTQNAKDEIEDEENLFELEIKNLDTNEVFKMQIPIGQSIHNE